MPLEGINIAGRLYLPDEAGLVPYPVVCVCHGLPSGRSSAPDDGGYPRLAERICAQGFAVFIFSFRGTGTSGGNLDMPGWTRDLTAAIDYLYTLFEVDRLRLSLLGFSAGAAVSVRLAAGDSRVSSVVACACPADFNLGGSGLTLEHFRNIGTIRDDDFPSSTEEWLKGFEAVSPARYVAEIAPRPLLLVHGSLDETVNVSQAYQMYLKARQPKQIIVIDGAGHRLRQNDIAMSIVVDWLKSLSRYQPSQAQQIDL